MNIVIIGAGKIGATLTEQLLREGHEITVVDTRTAALDAIGNTLDVMTVEGNGISMDTQMEAGVPSADLVIAVMSTDEQNLLSCLIAKRLGVGNTIARVRNPEYTSGLHLIQDDLGLSMALNPELASATEIARILRAPASIKIDTFSKGRVELHKMRIDPGSMLDGMKLSDLGRLQSGALVCVVERGQHEVYIPDGSFTLLAGDRISVVASPKLAAKFFHKIGVQTNPVKRVMLLGGGHLLLPRAADAGLRREREDHRVQRRRVRLAGRASARGHDHPWRRHERAAARRGGHCKDGRRGLADGHR